MPQEWPNESPAAQVLIKVLLVQQHFIRSTWYPASSGWRWPTEYDAVIHCFNDWVANWILVRDLWMVSIPNWFSTTKWGQESLSDDWDKVQLDFYCHPVNLRDTTFIADWGFHYCADNARTLYPSEVEAIQNEVAFLMMTIRIVAMAKMVVRLLLNATSSTHLCWSGKQFKRRVRKEGGSEGRRKTQWFG